MAKLNVSSSPFEAPKLALGRLVEFDASGAARALFAPESLSPAERRTLADKWGLADDSWWGKLVRIVENPLVLIGAVLAIRYPIATAEELFKFAPALSGVLRNPRFRRFTGGIDEIFAGLTVAKNKTLPEAYQTLLREVQTFRKVHADDIATAINQYESSSGLKFDKRTQILLAAKLERLDEVSNRVPWKFKKIELGKAFDKLVGDVREINNRVFDQVFGRTKIEAYKRALREQGIGEREFQAILKQRAAAKAAGESTEHFDEIIKGVRKIENKSRQEILSQLRNSGIDTSVLDRAKRIDAYFPHRVARTLKDFDRQTDLLIAIQDEKDYARKMIGGAGRTQHAKSRIGHMLPNPDDLRVVQDALVRPGGIKLIESRLASSSALRPYSLDFNKTMSSYLHSVARAWGWTVQGHGADIMRGVRMLEDSGLPHNVVRASMLKNSYIPVALGRQTFKQMLQAAQWDATRLDLVRNLQGGKLSKFLPKSINSWLTERLVQDDGIFTLRNVQGRLASHFYLGALGMNPVSSAWNLMQTMLTTVPTIGPKSTLEGLQRVFSRVPKYFNLRKAGVVHEEALARTFKEFAQAGLAGAPFTEDALNALDRAWEVALRVPPNARGKVDLAKSAMMSLFQTSETLVRLTAFEGTMAKGLREGLSVAQAAPIARRVTEATQFLTGPANVPAALLNTSPLVRQFATFPTRYADFLFGTATEIGSAANRGGLFGMFPNRNFGTVGRAMLTSGVTYEAAKQFFDTDLSKGLLFGALPSRPESAVLSPLPFVPPAIGLAASAFQAMTTGDTTQLRRQLPILVPGGVELARATTEIAPEVAKFLGRDYADYNSRSVDGRVPVYSPNGSLKGMFTPMQLHMRSLGIPPGGPADMQRESDLERFLLANRDRIRSMRKEFLDAIVRNDSRAVARIKDQYEKAYPGMGGLQIREQDLRAVHLRNMVPRLERTLETLPQELRPMFGQAISTALGQEAEGLLGVDPELLRAPDSTIRSRERFRKPRPQNVIEELRQKVIERRQMRR